MIPISHTLLFILQVKFALLEMDVHRLYIISHLQQITSKLCAFNQSVPHARHLDTFYEYITALWETEELKRIKLESNIILRHLHSDERVTLVSMVKRQTTFGRAALKCACAIATAVAVVAAAAVAVALVSRGVRLGRTDTAAAQSVGGTRDRCDCSQQRSLRPTLKLPTTHSHGATISMEADEAPVRNRAIWIPENQQQGTLEAEDEQLVNSPAMSDSQCSKGIRPIPNGASNIAVPAML